MPGCDVRDLVELGQQLRVDAVRCAEAAGSGHRRPGQSRQRSAELLQGHASPSLYAVFAPSVRSQTGRLITVEDHWPQGGLGDAVLDVFADGRSRPRIVKLAVRSTPGSAMPAEQLREAGIDRIAIADTACAFANTPATASSVRTSR